MDDKLWLDLYNAEDDLSYWDFHVTGRKNQSDKALKELEAAKAELERARKAVLAVAWEQGRQASVTAWEDDNPYTEA